jgi:hypothetical protein
MLINRAECKRYILQAAERVRPGWTCRRVSRQALDVIEARLRHIITDALKRHPARGCTFTEV